MDRPNNRFLVAGLMLVLFTGAVFGDDADNDRSELNSRVFTITLENDRLMPIDATDRHYTHGTHLSYWMPENTGPSIITNWGSAFLEHFPPLTLKTEAHRFGFAISQQIYTPTDLETTTLIRNDRPYGGWLYGAFLFQRRGMSLGDYATRDNFELTFGLVGDRTFAGDTQNRWHRIINVEEAHGWDNQVHDEPAFNFNARRSVLMSCRSGDWGIDLIPHLGMSLGNVMIFGSAGLEARFGWRLPNDFGVSTTEESPALYMFTGIEGRAVAWNIFLDGNTYQHSHHVNKLPFVTDLKYGLAWKACENFELTYTYIYRTREFRQQRDADRFGSLALKFIF